MNKLYLISYNLKGDNDKIRFHDYIKSLCKNDYITDWWHYIDNSYIVASSLNVEKLYDIVSKGNPNQYIFIVEVDTENAQGWLPKKAWDWLSKYWK